MPTQNVKDASVVDGIKTAGANSLADVVGILNKDISIKAVQADKIFFFKGTCVIP